MNRLFVIVVLTVLFHLLNSPAQILAQVPDQFSEQRGITVTGKNVNSLTTTDLLNSQDFAPQVTELPAKRSRIVNPVKKTKTSTDTFSVREPSETASKRTGASLASAVDLGIEEMVPSQRPRQSFVTEEVKVQVSTSPNFATGSNRIDDMIVASAERNGIDHHLILAVMKQESSFNPQAISYKGARGLMQLMPATAARFGVRDIFDPAQNIEGGARYLRFLLDTFKGDIELTLAGYNAGENAVFRYGNQIPPYRETQDYVRKISAHYARLKNGAYLRRPNVPPAQSNRRAESEVITAGQTMTQY